MTEKYMRYLHSDKWRALSEKTKERDGMRCLVCGSRRKLQAHHINYTHLYNEEEHPEVLLTVCDSCHVTIHNYMKACKAVAAIYETPFN